MSRITTLLALTILSISFSYGQINRKLKKTGSHYQNKTSCVQDKMDGTFVLKAWGKGKDKTEALDQAKRNALNDVIFNGIRGGEFCKFMPLVSEVQAKEKYSSYFYNFFQKDYKKYIKIEDSPKKRMKSKTVTNYGFNVIVMREELKIKLKTDNIIK
jgi:hypothetical protein